MSQANYSVVTTYGREWNARAAAGDEVSPITEMVFGDGDRAPTGGETALVNEVHRQTLSGQGSYEDQSAAYFDAYLEAAIGGFVIREHGLVTADGNLVAIGVRNPGIPKADPATGAADDFTYRIDLFFDQMDALVVEVDPRHGLTAERRVDTGDGLTGGGALGADLTISLDATVARTSLQAALASNQADLITQQMAQEIRLRTLEHKPTANMETAL